MCKAPKKQQGLDQRTLQVRFILRPRIKLKIIQIKLFNESEIRVSLYTENKIDTMNKTSVLRLLLSCLSNTCLNCQNDILISVFIYLFSDNEIRQTVDFSSRSAVHARRSRREVRGRLILREFQ